MISIERYTSSPFGSPWQGVIRVHSREGAIVWRRYPHDRTERERLLREAAKVDAKMEGGDLCLCREGEVE